MRDVRAPRYRGCRAVEARRSVKMMGMGNDDAEQALRRRVVDQARASSALEGQRSSAQARADQEAWVRGEIDVDELLERVRRYE